MKRLFLLRHAKSSWDQPGLDDFDRPLSSRGRRAGAAMGRWLAHGRIHPDLVLCSSACRTRQTMALLEEALGACPVQFEDGLYHGAKDDLLGRLRNLDDHVGSVMVIGHNPALEGLAADLVATQGSGRALARMKAKFPTCALAEIECDIVAWTRLDGSACRLVRFVTPAEVDKDGFK